MFVVQTHTNIALKHNRNRLFSKFTISTAAYQHVRLASASLEADEGEAQGLVVRGTLPQKRNITVNQFPRPQKSKPVDQYVDHHAFSSGKYCIPNGFKEWSRCGQCLYLVALCCTLMHCEVRDPLWLCIKYRMLRDGENRSCHSCLYTLLTSYRN